MDWLGLAIWYMLSLGITLWIWNRNLSNLLPVFVVMICVAFVIAAFLGISAVYVVSFIIGILLSLLTWWYTAQIVKPQESQPALAWRLSFLLLGSLHLLFGVLPILIWGDWKIALVVGGANYIASMRAAAISTDAYVLRRASQISRQGPELHAKDILAQAESEMRANVSNTPNPSLNPHAANLRQLVDAAERTVSDALSELNIGSKGPFRAGAVAFTLYCFDLRIGQFFDEQTAHRFVTECQQRFAKVVGVTVGQFADSYRKYAPAFYAVDNWFHHGGPSDRDESHRGIVAAEKYWEIIANGPGADTSRRSNPNTRPQDPGGFLSLMYLQNIAVEIANFCKDLSERGVRLR